MIEGEYLNSIVSGRSRKQLTPVRFPKPAGMLTTNLSRTSASTAAIEDDRLRRERLFEAAGLKGGKVPF
jgi:hypothetical protein